MSNARVATPFISVMTAMLLLDYLALIGKDHGINCEITALFFGRHSEI